MSVIALIHRKMLIAHDFCILFIHTVKVCAKEVSTVNMFVELYVH